MHFYAYDTVPIQIRLVIRTELYISRVSKVLFNKKCLLLLQFAKLNINAISWINASNPIISTRK